MRFSSSLSRPLVLALVLMTALVAVASAQARPRRREGRIALSNHISLANPSARRHLLRDRQAPTSTAPIADPGTLLFQGDQLSDYPLLQEAPGAITEVPNPLGGNESVLKMTVKNSDVAPITPTDNPRAQAVSPEVIEPGKEFWLQTKFLLPTNLPSIPGWMSLVAVYGAPFDGPGPWDVEVSDNELRWQRNSNYDWDIPWSAPLVKGQWVTVTLHEKFATEGWVEMWINGEPVSFFTSDAYNPLDEPETQRLPMQTMDSSDDAAPNSARIMQYREAGMFSTASTYFGSLNIGTSRSAVAG
jgi:hypothetical protein